MAVNSRIILTAFGVSPGLASRWASSIRATTPLVTAAAMLVPLSRTVLSLALAFESPCLSRWLFFAITERSP